MTKTRRFEHLRKIIIALTAALAVVVGTLVFLPTAAQATPCDGGGSVCIDSVSPSTGSTAGGSEVTIRGNHFSDHLINSVKFGGTPGTAFARVSNEELTVKTPAHVAGAVAIELFEGEWLMHTRADGFTFQAPAATPADGSVSVGFTNANVGESLKEADLRDALAAQISALLASVKAEVAALTVKIAKVSGKAPKAKSLTIAPRAGGKAVCKLSKNKKSVKMLRTGTCTIKAQLSIKARKKAPKHKAAKRNVKLVVTVR